MLGHKEFVKRYNDGTLKVNVSKSQASHLAVNGHLPPGYRGQTLFYSWLWIIGLIGAIPIWYFYGWIWGLLTIFIAVTLPKALKNTNCKGVIEKALVDEAFFKDILEEKIMSIEETGREVS